MDNQAILKLVHAAAEDKNAQHPILLDIRGLSVLADYFFICHGNSEIQVQAIAQAIYDEAFQNGLEPKPMEGYEKARWVLIDLGDVVAHVFHKEDRDFYHLEKLWSDANQIEVEQIQ